MSWGLLGAFGAALCYGAATVLQALAARAEADAQGLDPRLLLRLVRSWRYVTGLALDAFAFLLTVAALQTMPLFAVQAVVASFLAVTAVLGAVFLDMPLTRTDKGALVVVIAGMVLVGLSAAEDRVVDAGSAQQWGVLAAAIVLAAVAVPLGRVPGATGAAALGAVAGLGFGAVAVAARMLPRLGWTTLPEHLGELLTNPATYALVVAAVVALLSYSIALQRGTVTQATAPLVIGETLVPALVGVVVLGDTPRPGWGWAAVVGFALAVGGAVALARHGELEPVAAAGGSDDAGAPPPSG
jgi:drug/metabolite transporter (DMT)-like permease